MVDFDRRALTVAVAALGMCCDEIGAAYLLFSYDIPPLESALFGVPFTRG